jgi:hypothetical protein
MPVHTPVPKNRNSARPAKQRESQAQLHILRDPLNEQQSSSSLPALARPRALAAANPAGIRVTASIPSDFGDDPGANATLVGTAAPTLYDPRGATPNGTVLGHLPFAKQVDLEVERIRFAEGTKPRRMDAPKPANAGSQGVAARVAGASKSIQMAPAASDSNVGTAKFDKAGEVDETTAKVSASKWKAFEAIGLTPKPLTSKAQKMVVSSYRMLGFGILTLIVFVLVGYIATTVFYFFNTTWMAPVAVSPSDEKVVQLQAELAKQQNERDKLADQLSQADRIIATEQNFQLEYAKAIKHDLEGRSVALASVRRLAGAAAAARGQISRTNEAYAEQSKKQMDAEYDAGLIDRQKMLAGNYQLAQISTSNLSLAQRQAEFEQKAAELAIETKSLDAVLSDKKATALSYDVLKIKRDYDTSKLALANEMQMRGSLKASVERQDALINTLKKSAYLRALTDAATVAFVPYGNIQNVSKGVELYGCKLAMVMCHKVGTAVEVLPGEVQFKHPRRDKLVRGRMVELKLDADETTAAEDDILFIGSKPLWF